MRLAVFTRLRAGELVVPRASRLDLIRRRVEVNESGSDAYGQLPLIPTKTYERRTVPIPASLIDELPDHLAGAAPDDFVWQSPQGGPFRYSNWFKRHFKPSVIRAGLPTGTPFTT